MKLVISVLFSRDQPEDEVWNGTEINSDSHRWLTAGGNVRLKVGDGLCRTEGLLPVLLSHFGGWSCFEMGKGGGQKLLFTSEMMRGYGTYFQHCRCVSNFCVAQLNMLEFSGGGCHQKVKSTVGHP